MLQKILDKLGYVKKDTVSGFRDLSINPFTEHELSLMLAELYADVDIASAPEFENKVLREAKNVEGLVEYLRVAAARDINRFFVATPEEQPVIRGAFARTNYLKSRIASSDMKSKSIIPGIKGN